MDENCRVVAAPNKSARSSSVPSLPPPCPKSPPEYPDLYGKRREMAKVQMLEREIGFLEEEIKSVQTLHPASRSCKEITDFVVANPDPLIHTNRKNRKSCRFWKWLCGMPCFNCSWICCCCCNSGCPLSLNPCSCCRGGCSRCSDCGLSKCCCSSCIPCKAPKCKCCSSCFPCGAPKCKCCSCCSPCPCSCTCTCSCPKSNCCRNVSCRSDCCNCGKPSCSCSCCKCSLPKCSNCNCNCNCFSWLCCCPKCSCSLPTCRPKCPKVRLCCNCTKNSCNPCCCLFF